MTLLDQLRILRIPAAVKALLALVALCLVALNIYVIYRGLQDQSYDFWVAAGASLLAAAAPALAVVSVLLVTESGMAALKRRMQQMLAKEIPGELRFTFEAPSPRLDAQCKPDKLAYRPNRARVECGMYRDELWANYLLSARTAGGQAQVARMRIELVMRRVNVNLVFDRALAAKRLGHAPEASLADLGAAFLESFKHTVSGATGAGYHFNSLPMLRQIDGREELAFVATRAIEAEFVWDPAARLEFIQDLVLMMRSFVNERPDIFAPEEKA
jgi:hypothetical protein